MASVGRKSYLINPLSSFEGVSESTGCGGAGDTAYLCFQKGFDKAHPKRMNK